MRIPARETLLLALAFAGVQLPFLGQALVIDDGNFVDQAMHVLSQPAAPYSFPIHFGAALDFFYYFANPPGLAYFYAAVIAVFGDGEVALHAASLLFSGAAVACMFGWSQRETRQGLVGALLLLATPAFLVSSHTLMADVPAAALTLCAIACFVRGLDDDRPELWLLAGAAAGGAALFKYSALSSLVLIALYAASSVPRLGGRRCAIAGGAALAVAALLFGLWCLASRVVYGEVHVLAAGMLEGRALSLGARARQGLAAFADLGGATIFAPSLLAWSLAGCFSLGRVAGFVTATSCAGLALLAFVPPSLSLWEGLSYTMANRVLLAVLLAAGSATVGFAACSALGSLLRLRSPNAYVQREAALTLLLAAWLLGFVAIDAGLLFATPKYLVPAVAPLVLLLLRSTPGAALAASPAAVAGVIAATAAFGLLLSVANADYANSLRRFSTQTAPEIAMGRPLWFTGHHAVRYYAQRQGQLPLPEQLAPGATPREGDVVYVIRGASKHAVPVPLRAQLDEIARVEAYSPLPFVMNNLRQGAGYWAHGSVPLPYAFSTEPHSTLEVYRLRP